MRSLSSVGLALSIVFGFLLLALLAELYYLLWCKKKKRRNPHLENDYSTPRTRELIFILCCNNTNPSSSSFSNPKAIETQQQQQQQQRQQQCLLDDGFTNAIGPGIVPRFLFTIMEETEEDIMESQDCVSIKGKSLHDLFLNMESGGCGTPPYLTPRASPSLFTPPLTPLSCNGRKEASLSFCESLSDAEFNRLVRSSPLSSSSPLSRFKFLRDAEEKLYKREVMEIAEAEELKG